MAGGYEHGTDVRGPTFKLGRGSRNGIKHDKELYGEDGTTPRGGTLGQERLGDATIRWRRRILADSLHIGDSTETVIQAALP